MKSRVYMVFVLTLVAVISSGLLAYFAVYTHPYIEKNKKAEVEKAIKEVVPGTVTNKIIKDENKFKIFACYDKDGKTLGYAVYTVGTGFQDLITIMFGVDKYLDKMFRLEVLEQKETPGLGAKITDKDLFLKFWKNKNITGEIILAKPPKGESELKDNEVNAISGATISSRSVVSIVNKALKRVKEEVKNG